MRRIIMVLGVCLVAGVLWLPIAAGSLDTTPTASPSASPAASPADSVPLLGTYSEAAAELPIPAAAPLFVGDPDVTLRLKRVELGPNTATDLDGHIHNGAFTLFVDSGAICYAAFDVAAGTTVTAYPASDAAAPAGCPVTIQPGSCPDGCALQKSDIVYLPTWSSLIQSGSNKHEYWNPHKTRTAIVYLAELQRDDDMAPCRGGCN